jgi:hypothetical protein
LNQNIADLKNEFEQFVVEKCSTDESCDTQDGDIPEEELPYFTEELAKKLLSPEISGVNLSRIDLKRVSDDLEDSIAIQARKRMLKAILRHKQTKEELGAVFNTIELHLNGRILIYREIGESYPASNYVFENYISKIEKMKRTFKRILDDFEDISPNSQPIHFDDV